MAFAQLSKVRLEYFPHGAGPEKIVFIHGFQASARIWQPTQHALPSDLYASIAVNNRGAGGSEAPPRESDFSVPHFSDDAFELVSQLGWRDFTMVGHSLGGSTAAQFAVDHPTLLKGVVMLDPAGPDGPAPPAGLSVDDMVDRMMAARQARAARGEAGDGIDASGAGASGELMRALAADMAAASERRLRGSARSMFEMRLGDRLKALTLPMLLAAGDADELIPLASMLAALAKYPPGTGLHVWHGVGHSPNLDCPGDLAAVLRRFIEVTIPARRK